jgi:hypothetical protein
MRKTCGDDMKRESISLAAGLPYLLITFVISIYPAKVLSQNSAVRWSTFDMGFSMSFSSNTVLMSAIGQGFVGTIQQDNTRIESGFLAGTLIRRTITSAIDEPLVPLTFLLRQNYPNPFNPSTTISFSLPLKSLVSLKVYDLLGREVTTIVSEEMSAGNYSRQWNANGMSSGVYFYRLQAGSSAEVKKLVLLR